MSQNLQSIAPTLVADGDTGTEPFAGLLEETVTEGLDKLGESLVEYHGRGARFAKWRAVIPAWMQT